MKSKNTFKCYGCITLSLQFNLSFPLLVPPHPQISVFSFDIFLEAGIPREKIRYVTLGVGVSEVLTSISCVSDLEMGCHLPYSALSALYSSRYSLNIWGTR